MVGSLRLNHLFLSAKNIAIFYIANNIQVKEIKFAGILSGFWASGYIPVKFAFFSFLFLSFRFFSFAPRPLPIWRTLAAVAAQSVTLLSSSEKEEERDANYDANFPSLP